MAHIQIPPHDFEPDPPTQTGATVPSAFDRFMKDLLPSISSPSSSPFIPVPITPEAFAPYGQLIIAYPDIPSRPPGMDIQTSPDGKTNKYARLADIIQTYPEGTDPLTGISVFRATPKIGLERGKVFDVRFMERHPFTTQAFIPMGKGEVSRRPAFGKLIVSVETYGRGSVTTRRRNTGSRGQKRLRQVFGPIFSQCLIRSAR